MMIMRMSKRIMIMLMMIRVLNTQSVHWSWGLESDHDDEADHDHHIHVKYDRNDDNHHTNQDADHPVLALEWGPQLVRLVTHR